MLWLAAGLLLIGIAAEVYLRATSQFHAITQSWHFVPGVGVLYEPMSELRYTNGLDFWTTTRVNSAGFLDRETPQPHMAAQSCHITLIGDSFVAAIEVPIAEKSHIRLEELAAQQLPQLEVTTSAFGIGGTAPVNQLPFYDEYARQLRPKLLILVINKNDLKDNSPDSMAIQRGWIPGRAPYASFEHAADGTIRLRPPDPQWGTNKRPLLRKHDYSGTYKIRLWATSISYFAHWLDSKIYRQRSALFSLTDVTVLSDYRPPADTQEKEDQYLALALEEFRRRASRDGVSMVILASHTLGGRDHPDFRILNDIAETIGIPVINQHEHIISAGLDIKDLHFRHDAHWNATGHQIAAEALLEYLRQHPDICRQPAST